MDEHHLILRVVTKILIGPIILYGLYVQFHGDFSPGGGFQAGVIVAVGLILYGLIFGHSTLLTVVPIWFIRTTAGIGVLIYASIGVIGMLMGSEFLDYSTLADPQHPQHGQHLGIMLIEAGVGLTVASIMTLIYCIFADLGRPMGDDEW